MKRKISYDSLPPSKFAHIDPTKFVESCFQAHMIDTELKETIVKDYFQDVTDDRIDSYQEEIGSAIRSKNIDALRLLKKKGSSFNGCNRHGESFLHLACRRGFTDIVSFLINEGNASVRVRDDFGRTPLHDACWATSPNFELFEMLLDKEPHLLLMKDVRGHSPLDYVRKEHWGIWVKFLSSRIKTEIILRKRFSRGRELCF